MKNLNKALIGLAISLAGFSLSSAKAEYEIDINFYQDKLVKDYQEQELKCLARNIFFEAGGESYNGKLAVAQVTLNRVNHEKFPNTICGVVKQKTVWQGKTVCQFSWFCTHKAKSVIQKESKSYQESMMAARQILLEGLGLNHLKDALYFHAVHVSPNWGKIRIARIGNHIFYKDTKSR